MAYWPPRFKCDKHFLDRVAAVLRDNGFSVQNQQPLSKRYDARAAEQLGLDPLEELDSKTTELLCNEAEHCIPIVLCYEDPSGPHIELLTNWQPGESSALNSMIQRIRQLLEQHGAAEVFPDESSDEQGRPSPKE